MLLLVLGFGLADARADTYPKNPRIDVVNYRFALDLQDRDERIEGRAEIDLRFTAGGETALRFDLVNHDAASGHGMTVSEVSSDGVSLPFTHDRNALTIALPRPAGKDDTLRVRIVYGPTGSCWIRTTSCLMEAALADAGR